MELTFEDATESDLEDVVRLLYDDEVGRTREVYTPGSVDPRYLAAFREISRDPNNEIILARQGKRVVAVLQLTFIPNLAICGSRRALVESVRVDTSLRRQGIGKKLMVHALVRAKERNCVALELTTAKFRKDAPVFYEALGFKASHTGFKFDLAKPLPSID